jgi:YVTN family beta-propeller protein
MRGRLRRSLPVAGGILGAALIAGVVLSRGGSDDASAPRVAGAQVLTIDAASDRPRQAVRIPVPPSAIAADPTGVWLTDPDDNLLARVDRGSGEITARLAMPSAPGAIAVGDGAVWVASSVSGAVSRVDPVTARTTQTIRLHGHASTVAYGAGRVWVADENGRTLTRLHPATGRPERTTTLDDRPTAITVAFGLVWVASQAADTVTALDPRTMARLATIGVGGAPVALAAGGGSLWVANSLDATVSRIEPGRPRVLATIAVGGEPTALAFARSSLWVASEAARTLTRISAESNAVAARIAVLARPTSLALTGSAILVGARPAGPERRGGTLRLLAGNVPIMLDPAHQLALLPPQFLGLSHDGLVTYNHVGGAQGLGLVPDLALALPKPDASATLFGFRLRPGIRYSTGAPVEPSDFRRAFERIFRTRSPAVDYFSGIAGATRCLQRPRRCDLRAGVAADDTARTVTFHLSAPDPDFLYKLAALNYASPIPPGTPMRDTGLRPVPGTGPYRVAAAGRREIRFVRNPYFREWSHAAQPAGNPDEIVWRFGQDRAAQVRAVRAGSADWTFAGVPEQLATEIANRHAAQLHINDVPQTDFLQLNPRGTPFRDVRVRRAFNLALDRREIVERYGGPDQATPTCQVLPHGVRARRDYCPYTRDPRPDGVWRGPDLRRARRLVAASGTAGARVTIWSFSDGLGPDGIDRRATDVLRALGFRVRLRSGTHHDYERLPERERDAIDVIPSSWYADFPSPSTFFDTFLACRSATAGGFYCDPTLDRMMRRARAIEATDPARADAAWATVDRRAVDRAAWVPLVNPREVDFVSTRLRDYEYNPIWGFLASQASLE